MGLRKKKYECGASTTYLTQKKAQRKLQISLDNFRRLCIIKGIYPVEPKSRSRANKGSTQPRVFYFAKDIAFLAREPLLQTFRKLRIYQRKLKHAREKSDREAEFRIRMNKPRYSLHEIVKERYPSREDALRDISDSLNLIFLFSRLPKLPQFSAALISLSRRFSVEFLNYIVAVRGVRKAFISIKGIYVQAEINGIPVVWIMPHNSVTHTPSHVDYRILATCLEFDITLVGSMLCNLYKNACLVYPPKLAVAVSTENTISCTPREQEMEYLSCLSYPISRLTNDTSADDMANDTDLMELQQMDDQVSQALSKQAEVQRIKHLFEGKRFFLNRETPREVLTLIIRSCGGLCSWDGLCGPGATFRESDQQVDYQIVDRPMKEMKVGRYYVQPQWIFDSVNAMRLMPEQDYMPGCELPAHLSPFALAFSETADPNLHVKQRETPLAGSAPGYGAGAALYRPPEADYLRGLVSLAEIRGAAVMAQKEANAEMSDEEEVDEEELPDEEDDEEEIDDEDEEEIDDEDEEEEESEEEKPLPVSKKPKLEKAERKPAALKGENISMQPGKVDTQDRRAFKQKAQENAEKKLLEMQMHKKHKRVYNAMKKSIKGQNKELEQLQKRRSDINMNKDTGKKQKQQSKRK